MLILLDFLIPLSHSSPPLLMEPESLFKAPAMASSSAAKQPGGLITKPSIMFAIPPPNNSLNFPKPNERDRNFSLAFDPSKSPHYKVVSMGSQILVYSSETRSWKLFMDKNSLREFGGFHYGRSVYLNGALIWASKECLLSFDAERESMKKLPMPPEPHQCSRVVYLGSSGGKLQMIGMRNNEKITATFDIFEMDSQCSGWSVLHHVDLSEMLDLYPGVRRQPIWINGPPRHDIRQLTREHPAFLPVHFMHGEKEGVEGDGLLLLCVPRKIVSYNLKDKALTEVCDIDRDLTVCIIGKGSSSRVTHFSLHELVPFFVWTENMGSSIYASHV